MRSVSYILATAALAVAVSAQTTTEIQVFAAGPTDLPVTLSLDNMAGSIVGANAVATTVAVDCVTSDSNCPITTPWTIIEGPSTFDMRLAMSTESEGLQIWVTITETCKITSLTSASCSNSVDITGSLDGVGTSTNSAAHTTYTSDEIYYQTLTITGGVSILNQPQATQTPAAGAGRMGLGGAAAAVAAAAAAGFL
jgi:hypothetical protein